MSNLFKTIALSAIAAVFMASAASAATVTVSTQGGNAFLDSYGKNAWYETTSYKLNGVSRTAAAGLFRLKATAVGGAITKFVGVCLEPLETLRLPKLYDESTPLGYLTVARLGALVDNALKLVKDSKSAAAFQLAAWEIANEGKGGLDLKTGAFQLTSSASGTQGLAQGWLDSITGGKWKLNNHVTILQAPGTQDLLTDIPAQVPVPAAGFLLIAGLGGLAGLKRARRA